MPKWKTNDYFSPKSWGRLQEEKRDEELAKVSASPLPMLLWIGFLGLLFAACVIGFVLSFLR